MQTETPPAPVLTYDPAHPYRHARNAEKAIWLLPISTDAKKEICGLVILAEREAFSRGLAPDRPLNY